MLSTKLQDLQKKHDELLAELAEAQRRLAEAGSTRLQLENRLKTLEGRPDAESVAERYEQAKVNEKNLIGCEREARKNLDVFLVQKTAIEEHIGRLGKLTGTD